MRKKWILLAPVVLLALVVFVAVGGEIVRLLWNWLLPPLFGWQQITLWQALGLLLLCRILFGGLGVHGRARSTMGRRMAERWAMMTPEERERFRQGVRGRCGVRPSATEPPAQ